ncbi:MAG TPA: zinc finger domain-containing protein, partial [Candidatus Acidoferrum sp.]|nr:zinc finger domain-containing protein [Candidatus Acidoferrum sp.]
EAWQHLQPELQGQAESVFDLVLPSAVAVDEGALGTWALLKQLRAQVASSEGVRDFQLDADVLVQDPFYEPFLALGDNLREALVVSALRGLRKSANGAASVIVVPAAGEKCQRCWKFLPLGSDHEHPALCASCTAVVHELEG